MMMTTKIFNSATLMVAVVLASSHLVTVTDGAASYAPYLCDPTYNICATVELYSPSPAAYENGTVAYMGGYSYIYSFLPTGLDETSAQTAEPYGHVEITRDDNNNDGCNVTVDDQQCLSCTYCGNYTFSADCTNIEHGRMVECESALPVYFPLTIDAIPPLEGGAINGNSIFWAGSDSPVDPSPTNAPVVIITSTTTSPGKSSQSPTTVASRPEDVTSGSLTSCNPMSNLAASFLIGMLAFVRI